MILRARYAQLQALLVLLIAIYVVLIFGGVLHGEGLWLYLVLAIPIALVAAKVNIDRIRRRAEKLRAAKAARDSVLKNKWEGRHSREW